MNCACAGIVPAYVYPYDTSKQYSELTQNIKGKRSRK